MTTKNFSVFDCDSHVVEPPEIWDEYVPAKVRTWVKTQFHFHTDTDLLCINGRVVPAARERSNAAEVGWPRSSRPARRHGRARHRPGDAVPELVREARARAESRSRADPDARVQRLGLRLLRRRSPSALSLRGAAHSNRRRIDRGAATRGEARLPRGRRAAVLLER